MVSVKGVMEKYNVLVVHGIMASEGSVEMPKHLKFPGRNLEWDQKLENLVINSPTISASTIQECDSLDNFWSPMGVIINNGKVKFAAPYDFDSTLLDNGERVPYGLGIREDFNEPIEEQVGNAITRRARHMHNELIIKDPKLAGFYFLLDPRARNRVDYREISEISPKLANLEMPLYVINKGRVYEARYNPQTRWVDFSIKKPITREEFNNYSKK